MATPDDFENKRALLEHEYSLKDKQARLEFQLTRYRDWQIASFKALIEFAHLSVRALLLLNGGALIAILALFGHLVGRSGSIQALPVLASEIRWAIYLYIAGLVLGAGTGMLAYLSQTCFTHASDDTREKVQRDRFQRVGTALQVSGIISCAVGLLAFVIASVLAGNSITAALGA
jgi:hypothetical protein